MSGYSYLGRQTIFGAEGFTISDAPSTAATATPIVELPFNPYEPASQAPPTWAMSSTPSQYKATPWKDAPEPGKKAEPSTWEYIKKFIEAAQAPGAPVPITPDPRTLAALKAKQDAEAEKQRYTTIAYGVGTAAGLTALFLLALRWVKKP